MLSISNKYFNMFHFDTAQGSKETTKNVPSIMQ